MNIFLSSLFRLLPSSFGIWVLVVALSIVSTGCISVGPDYEAPDIAISRETELQWSSVSPSIKTGELEPEFIASFWKQLGDPALDSLIDHGIKNNRGILQAIDRLHAASANRGIAVSAFFPSLDASASYTDQQTKSKTKDSQSSTTNLLSRQNDPVQMLLEKQESDKPTTTRRKTRSVGLDASWELDLFGGERRALEAADADLDAAKEAYRDTLTSLIAEVALNYISLRTYQNRLSIAEQNLKAQTSSLELALYRVQAGLADGLDEEQARLSIATTQSQIPLLKAGIAQTRFTLAALLGMQPEAFPKQISDLLAKETKPNLPASLVIDLPANAIRRRPDIRRAERKLASETASIGVRKADLYPRLVVPGSLSYSRSEGTDSLGISYGLRLSWNLFDAGATRRRIDIAEATRSEAFHAYEQTILDALSEISSSLTAYSAEEERRVSLDKAAGHAEKTATLTRLKYQTGLVAFSDVLTAEQTLLSRQNELAQSEGESMAHFIQLYKMIGGGWQPDDEEESE